MSNDMNKHNGKVVAITGASSGIGEAASRRLASEGARVIMGARRTEKLETIAKDIKQKGGDVTFKSLDVTDKTSVHQFINHALDSYGQLDVLINNAGVMPLSFLVENKTAEWDQMIDVNIKGLLYGISAALPIFTEQQSGQFINITSVADRVVTPATAVYSGTKFAIRAISDGLRQEVGQNIRVTIIAPGATNTELANHISSEQIKQAFEKDFFEDSMSPDIIAQSISYAISQPANVDVSEIVVRTTASPA